MRFFLLALALAGLASVSATYQIQFYYNDSSCDESVMEINVQQTGSCSSSACAIVGSGPAYTKTECNDDFNTPDGMICVETFNEANCSSLQSANCLRRNACFDDSGSGGSTDYAMTTCVNGKASLYTDCDSTCNAAACNNVQGNITGGVCSSGQEITGCSSSFATSKASVSIFHSLLIIPLLIGIVSAF